MSRNAALVARTVGFAAIGAVAGALIGGAAWIAAGAVSSAVAGLLAGLAGMRPFVATSVLVGTFGGILVGRGVVRALCLPGSCVGLEVTAAVISGLGALVGVGLVVALVTRSFDEYNEAIASRRPPPAPGCEAEPVDD